MEDDLSLLKLEDADRAGMVALEPCRDSLPCLHRLDISPADLEAKREVFLDGVVCRLISSE